MEGAFTEVIHSIFSENVSRSKVNEATCLSTLTLLCLKKDHGLKTNISNILKISLQQRFSEAAAVLQAKPDAVHTYNTPQLFVQPARSVWEFWSAAHHVVTLTRLSNSVHLYLDSLERFGRSCVTVLKVHAAIADRVLNEAEALDMSEHLDKCVKQISDKVNENLPTQSAHTLESFVRLLVSCYVLTEINDPFLLTLSGTRDEETQVFHNKQLSSVKYEECVPSMESIIASLSSSAPQVINRAYQEYLDGEKLSENCELLESFENGFILKSVHTLTDLLLLVAAVAKKMKHLQSVIAQLCLRLVNHCWEHLVQLYKTFPEDLPLKLMYVVFASSLRLCTVFETLQGQLDNLLRHDQTPHLAVTLTEFCDKLRAVIVSYHQQLCTGSLLHDACSHDWTSNQPLFDGERCSFSVQMWHYHLTGLEHDLRTLIPDSYSDVCNQMFLDTLSGTLCFLAGRYSLVTPSYRRVKQIRGDILTILLTVSSFLSMDTTLTHSTWSVIHAACTSLLLTMAITASPLNDLKECTTLCLPRPQQTRSSSKDQTDVWLSFMRHWSSNSTSAIPIFGHSKADQPGPTSELVLSREALILQPGHSYSQDTTSWPNLLQSLLTNDATLAVKLSKSEDFEPMSRHLVIVLSSCYQSPCALSQVYLSRHDRDSQTVNGTANYSESVDGFVQGALQLVIDALQEYVLLQATVFLDTDLQDGNNKVCRDWEMIIDGFVERVTAGLTPPLYVLLKTLADTEVGSRSLGERMARVLARILGPWLDSLLPVLHEPLMSTVATYASVLKHSLMGSLGEQGHTELDSLPSHLICSLQQLSPKLTEKFKSLEFTADIIPPGEEATFAEHKMIVELMEMDQNAWQSLNIIHSYLSSTHSTKPPSTLEFNPVKAYSTVHGVAVKSIMDGAEHVDWKDLLSRFLPSQMTREKLVMLTGKRWEFQEENASVLEENEIELVKSVKSLLEYLSDSV